MKAERILLTILCVLFLVSSGCSKKDVQPNKSKHEAALPTEPSSACASEMPPSQTRPVESEEYDQKSYCFDYWYNCYFTFGNGSVIAETDDTVYYLFGNTLYFSDKDYKEWMPLCPRPECSHTDKNCSAYVDSSFGIWIYDRYIYYVDPNGRADAALTDPSLCRMRFDGTQHEEVMKLKPHDFGYEPIRCNWSYFFTGKYFLYTYTAYKNNESPLGDDSWYYTLCLDSMELIDSKSADLALGRDSLNAGMVLAAKGDWLYGLDQDTVPYTVNAANIATREERILGEIPGELRLMYLDGAFGLIDNKLMFVLSDDAAKELYLYSCDLESCETALLEQGSVMDVKWLHFDRSNGYIYRCYCYVGTDTDEWGVYVFDSDLNTVDTALYRDMPVEMGMYFDIWQTDSYIFGAVSHDLFDPSSEPPPTWYIDKSDIGAGSLMWRRWEP